LTLTRGHVTPAPQGFHGVPLRVEEGRNPGGLVEEKHSASINEAGATLVSHACYTTTGWEVQEYSSMNE
jgi:hypothetical protein